MELQGKDGKVEPSNVEEASFGDGVSGGARTQGLCFRLTLDARMLDVRELRLTLEARQRFARFVAVFAIPCIYERSLDDI